MRAVSGRLSAKNLFNCLTIRDPMTPCLKNFSIDPGPLQSNLTGSTRAAVLLRLFIQAAAKQSLTSLYMSTCTVYHQKLSPYLKVLQPLKGFSAKTQRQFLSTNFPLNFIKSTPDWRSQEASAIPSL